jgi:hypothetical protein
VETPKVELSFSDILWAVGFLFGTGDSGLACSANEEKNIRVLYSFNFSLMYQGAVRI